MTSPSSGLLRQVSYGLANLGRLAQRPQAPAANLDFDMLPVLNDGLLMDVGLEACLGVEVGMAYVVAGHAGLKANFTSHGFYFGS